MFWVGNRDGDGAVVLGDFDLRLLPGYGCAAAVVDVKLVAGNFEFIQGLYCADVIRVANVHSSYYASEKIYKGIDSFTVTVPNTDNKPVTKYKTSFTPPEQSTPEFKYYETGGDYIDTIKYGPLYDKNNKKLAETDTYTFCYGTLNRSRSGVCRFGDFQPAAVINGCFVGYIAFVVGCGNIFPCVFNPLYFKLICSRITQSRYTCIALRKANAQLSRPFKPLPPSLSPYASSLTPARPRLRLCLRVRWQPQMVKSQSVYSAVEYNFEKKNMLNFLFDFFERYKKFYFLHLKYHNRKYMYQFQLIFKLRIPILSPIPMEKNKLLN